MSLPLATLWRHSSLILLRERSRPLFDAPAKPGAGTRGTGTGVQDARRLAFSSLEDADAYLRFWKGEVAAISQLRSALHRCGHSARVFACSDYEVIRALASQVVQGSLVLTETTLPYPPVDWLVVPASDREGPAAAAAAPVSATRAASPPVPLSSISAAPPAAPPMLPLLEEVQIEGAEVLPEIMQTLEQIDLTMGRIDLAAVSLEPAPSGVPKIDSAMKQASDSVTATLAGL